MAALGATWPNWIAAAADDLLRRASQDCRLASVGILWSFGRRPHLVGHAVGLCAGRPFAAAEAITITARCRARILGPDLRARGAAGLAE